MLIRFNVLKKLSALTYICLNCIKEVTTLSIVCRVGLQVTLHHLRELVTDLETRHVYLLDTIITWYTCPFIVNANTAAPLARVTPTTANAKTENYRTKKEARYF